KHLPIFIVRRGARMSAFQVNLNWLEEPLGFKILEWIASIFAFATCGGFKGRTEIQVTCPPKVTDNKTITATFGDPFRLNQASFQSPSSVNVCDVRWDSHVLIGDDSSSAQFYSRKLPMIAWAKALTDIKVATGPNIVQDLLPCKPPVTCQFGSVTSMGSLNVSVIFGFLNVILWGGNAWFVYKETSLHSPSNTSASHSQGGIPPPTGI
uniref:MARVEL domain-containing protein n=1 Tax=Jaculus jaculus TaxID=51337 RepID=A0A8C5K880_JACJA